MITTGKKDIFLSYISYFLRITSNIFLLPIILKKMPEAEYGLWNIYVAVGALVLLIDIGFSMVIVRFITYAFCGATDIPEYGIPNVDNNNTNYRLLFRVFFTGKRIYKKLFGIALVIVLLFYGYLLAVGGERVSSGKIIVSWGIYGFSICMYIYYVAYNCVIKGLGKLKESYIFYIVQQIIYIVIATVLLSLNMGILAIAIANFIGTFVFRLLNTRFIYRLFGSEMEVYHEVEKENKNNSVHIYDAIKRNTKGLAVVTISSYVVSYGGTLICSTFLSLDQIASYGLTNQLVGIIASVASIPFSTFIPKMSDLQLKGETSKLKNYYSIIYTFQLLVYLIGGSILVVAGNFVLEWYGTSTLMLSNIWITIMLLSSFAINNHQRCTNFIMLSNKQPHIKAYFISSIVTIIISLGALAVTRNVGAYILSALFVQLCYNAWKWPMEVNKQIQIKEVDKWKRSFNVVKNYIKGKEIN